MVKKPKFRNLLVATHSVWVGFLRCVCVTICIMLPWYEEAIIMLGHFVISYVAL